MEDTVVISSIRINKRLAQKLEFVAKKEGITKTDVIRRSLELYLAKEFEPKPKTAEDILVQVYKRTGRIPEIKRDVKELFDESYKEEPL